MIGGLNTNKTKPKIKKHYSEITFNEYSLSLISEYIIETLPDLLKLKKSSSLTVGGDGFLDEFNSWLKYIADPYHDFKPINHEVLPVDFIKGRSLIRMYQDILDRSPTASFENLVLIKILQEPNLDQGIPLKYCRFYKKTDKEYDADIWKKLEDNFDAIDMDSIFKFYILNATIPGTGSARFTQVYNKIVPLSAYWDTFRASEINFRILGAGTEAFYDSIYYNDICNELYYGTGIKFSLNENTDPKNIDFIISIGTASAKFIIHRQGFTIIEIQRTINELKTNQVISEPNLKNIIDFLKSASPDVSNNAIISFLLVCKMSGDIGCVYFIKKVQDSSYKIKYNETVFDLNVANKPIIFLYTRDKLCGALSIANDVKCVVESSPLKDKEVYLCQYVGSKGTFEESILEPYYKLLNPNFKNLSDNEKITSLINTYIREFNKVFKVSHVATNKDFEIVVSPDILIRYIIGLTSLKDYETNFDKTITFIINKHLNKQKKSVFLLSLTQLKALYDKLQTSNFFDPLLTYFMDILIIPNENIKKIIYDSITKRIKDSIGISLTDNYHSVNALLRRKEKVNNNPASDTLDTAMLDPQMMAPGTQIPRRKGRTN